MANLNEMANALKVNVQDFLTYILANYTTSPSDVSASYVYIEEPFTEDEESFKKRFQAANYHFVIANTTFNLREAQPTGHLIHEFNADIYVIRRTLQPSDLSNRRNLILYGGTDGAAGVVTSMQRICGDLQKYLQTYTLGGTLPVSSVAKAFRCNIETIEELRNVGNFFYCVCKFGAATIESKTISAT